MFYIFNKLINDIVFYNFYLVKYERYFYMNLGCISIDDLKLNDDC